VYKVERKDGRVMIRDWNDKMIYSATDDSYVVYRLQEGGNPLVVQVKSLTDKQLLTALATAVKLAL
jgi:hypothetical protein